MSKVTIEFDEKHLPILVSALETYSRLQTGQIKMALDYVYGDRMLDYDEAQYIENVVRFVAFPSNAKREYDGHGGFYDLYNNVYDEQGNLIEESEEWKKKKNRPHLDHSNSSFGVGCEECKEGTVCFEIKKQIEQYLHYKRNDGMRRICDVSGDGAMQHSDIPIPTIVGFKPEKKFDIPKKYRNKIQKLIDKKEYNKAWDLIDEAFKDNPLPKGKQTSLQNGFVIIKQPYVVN